MKRRESKICSYHLFVFLVDISIVAINIPPNHPIHQIPLSNQIKRNSKRPAKLVTLGRPESSFKENEILNTIARVIEQIILSLVFAVSALIATNESAP